MGRQAPTCPWRTDECLRHKGAQTHKGTQARVMQLLRTKTVCVRHPGHALSLRAHDTKPAQVNSLVTRLGSRPQQIHSTPDPEQCTWQGSGALQADPVPIRRTFKKAPYNETTQPTERPRKGHASDQRGSLPNTAQKSRPPPKPTEFPRASVSALWSR